MNASILLSVVLVIFCSAEQTIEEYATELNALYDTCTRSINNAASTEELESVASTCYSDLVDKASLFYTAVSENIMFSGNYMYSSSYWTEMLYYGISSVSEQYMYPLGIDDNGEAIVDDNLADAKETALRVATDLRDQFLETVETASAGQLRSGGTLADLKNELLCPELEAEGFRPYYGDVPGYDEVQIYLSVPSCMTGYVKNDESMASYSCLRCVYVQGAYQWLPMYCTGPGERYVTDHASYIDSAIEDGDLVLGGRNDYCFPMDTSCPISELQSLNAILIFYAASGDHQLTGYHDGCKAGTRTADNFNAFSDKIDTRPEVVCEGSSWVVHLFEPQEREDWKQEINSLEEFDKLVCVADGVEEEEEATTEETSTHAPIDASAYVNKGRKCTAANAERMRGTFEQEFYQLPSCLTVAATDEDGDGKVTFMATCACGCEECSQQIDCDTVTTTSGREIGNIVRVNRFFEFLESAGNCCAGCGCCN